jgi:hypothetical protein
MTLVLPLGTIFPLADATMSIVPHQAHTSPAQNSRMIVDPIARPIGDGGVSTISSAAGRNASFSPRLVRAPNGDDAPRRLDGPIRFSGLHEFLPAGDATMHNGRRS